MESLKFFRRTYKDQVVEYYFLPWRDDIRLTRRFGWVFFHYLIRCPESGNLLWTCASKHTSLLTAESEVLQREAIAQSYRSESHERLIGRNMYAVEAFSDN